MKNLPPGITVSEGGDAELQTELFDGFGGAMRSGLMMVYVVLAVLFTSLLQPVTILFSLPLSIAGAILALLITNLPITTPVVIGILMLMGIVTKNAIMLVDFAVEAMHGGVDRTTAIIEAGRKRARPIIDDDDRDGGRHGAERLGFRRRRRVPIADGDRHHRRPPGLDLAVAPFRAGVFHDHGRRGALCFRDCSAGSWAGLMIRRQSPSQHRPWTPRHKRWASPRTKGFHGSPKRRRNRNRGAACGRGQRSDDCDCRSELNNSNPGYQIANRWIKPSARHCGIDARGRDLYTADLAGSVGKSRVSRRAFVPSGSR